MIFLHPGLGYKNAHYLLAAEMNMNFRAVLAALPLYYLTITVFLFISNCIFPVLCISSST